jgi:membrane associated rhomboid family serine protease
MAECDACGKSENMPYQCRHCGGTYCADHRLPENHDCPGLDNWSDPTAVFDSGFDDSVNTGVGGASARSRTERLLHGLGIDTGPGSFLGYFRGNMTFVFLGLMWITFAFQLIVFPVLGFGPRTDLWRATFVISPLHPEYVWTWVTSVFSHGGFVHIAGNSIVIYFFGRIVERYVGSRDFTLLFLGSGILAGLGQIGIQMLQNDPTGALGASGAALAIMGVLTVLNPNLKVYLYFILPVPLWLITIGYAGLTVFGIFGGIGGGIAHVAHGVGLIIGLVYGHRVKDQLRAPARLQLGGGMRRGPGGPGGPGGRF